MRWFVVVFWLMWFGWAGCLGCFLCVGLRWFGVSCVSVWGAFIFRFWLVIWFGYAGGFRVAGGFVCWVVDFGDLGLLVWFLVWVCVGCGCGFVAFRACSLCCV